MELILKMRNTDSETKSFTIQNFDEDLLEEETLITSINNFVTAYNNAYGETYTLIKATVRQTQDTVIYPEMASQNRIAKILQDEKANKMIVNNAIVTEKTAKKATAVVA